MGPRPKPRAQVPADVARRADALVARLGSKEKAALRLRCGVVTLEAVVEAGQLQPSALARFVGNLERLEDEHRVASVAGGICGKRVRVPRHMERTGRVAEVEVNARGTFAWVEFDDGAGERLSVWLHELEVIDG